MDSITRTEKDVSFPFEDRTSKSLRMFQKSNIKFIFISYTRKNK